MRHPVDILTRRSGDTIKRNPTSEFTVHFLKHNRPSKKPLYTVAVWERNHLRAICHVAPVESVLTALRHEMENSGESVLEPRETPRMWRRVLAGSRMVLLKLASILLGAPSLNPRG